MVRLYRSDTDKKIAGICGGMASAYRIDSNLIRVVVVFLGVATGVLPALVAYIVGWVIIPERPTRGDSSPSSPHTPESSR